jgi:fucose permease
MATTETSAVRPTRRTGLLVLLLAYAGFVGLGLSNSLMGVAWPSVRDTFGQPQDALGVYLIGNTLGYMIASSFSGRLLARLGAGTTLMLSGGLASVSLLGAGGAPARPAGVGGGVGGGGLIFIF